MDCGPLSRALGETVAVLMTCGGVMNMMPVDIYSPINTVAAALAEVGLFLMIISLPSGADRVSRETT
jgi:ABC-type phosphate transport system permease subunit